MWRPTHTSNTDLSYMCVCVCVSALSAPRSVAEALQQRLDKYREAAESAQSKGDDRKARMHQRIVKVTHAMTHLNKNRCRFINLSCVCVLDFSNIKTPLKLIKQDGLWIWQNFLFHQVTLVYMFLARAKLLTNVFTNIVKRLECASPVRKVRNVPYNVLIKI